MEICPIKGYQVCRVSVTLGKSYKVEVLCIVDDIDECHILLGRPCQCEVNGKYDVKRNLYIFSWEGRRIAMVPPKVTLQVPKPKVKVEEKIVKAERKFIKDRVRHEKVFEVDEALDIENSRASYFQVRGIHVDETKDNAVWDWSSPKTLVQVLLMTYETEYDSDDDSDYQSDKSVDYLSPGEEELIQLRNRIKANREAKAKAKDNPVSKMSEPNNENSMPADNVRDPFISVEKHMERYPMYDETTHWRLRKPKVGEKYVSVAQFKECLTYYALANGFSLWYERSGEVRVVAKCGQRPPRLSDSEKEYEKTFGEHYAMLRSYGKVILDSHPGSTVKLGVTVNPDGKTYLI
ncbi:hypothetical protein Tco_0217942, partial [Tanacetum coccineum]